MGCGCSKNSSAVELNNKILGLGTISQKTRNTRGVILEDQDNISNTGGEKRMSMGNIKGIYKQMSKKGTFKPENFGKNSNNNNGSNKFNSGGDLGLSLGLGLGLGNNNNNMGEKRSNYLYIISPHNWLQILDYLVYLELKESGKINRTMNYLVKNSKILIKFFQNKKNKPKERTLVSLGTFVGKEGLIEGVNVNIHGNNTIVSLQSFNNTNNIYKEKNSVVNSSNSQSSGSKNYIKTISGVSSIKPQGINPNTLKSTNTSEEMTVIPHHLNTHLYTNLSLFIDSSPGVYFDYFTQNEIDWAYVKKEMNISNEMKTISVSGEQTPSFNSYTHSFKHEDKGFTAMKNKFSKLKLLDERDHTGTSNTEILGYKVKSPSRPTHNSSSNLINLNLSTKSEKKTYKTSTISKFAPPGRLNTIVEEIKTMGSGTGLTSFGSLSNAK